MLFGYPVNCQTPVLHEALHIIHERNNAVDRHAIAARKRLPGTIAESTIGHFPKEISRATRFIMFHGGLVTAKVMDTRHRRSPLIQGGLEIPIQVMVTMLYSPANKEVMIMYEDLVNKRYKEPQDGKFEDATKEILEAVSGDSDTDEDEDEEMEPEAAIPASS